MNCSGRVDEELGVALRFDEEGEGEEDMEDGDEDEKEGVAGSVGRREGGLNLYVLLSFDFTGMIMVDGVESVVFEGISTGGKEMEALGLLSTSSKGVLCKRNGSSGMAV